MNRNKEIKISEKDVKRINRFIIDVSKYVLYKVKCGARWQNSASRTLKAIGIS
jgi:hypothetical protein